MIDKELLEEEHQELCEKGYTLSKDKCRECKKGLLYYHGKYPPLCNNHKCSVLYEWVEEETK